MHLICKEEKGQKKSSKCMLNDPADKWNWRQNVKTWSAEQKDQIWETKIHTPSDPAYIQLYKQKAFLSYLVISPYKYKLNPKVSTKN